jgi:N-acetylglucosamine kinase-like BadF-type ATPase
MDAAGTALGHGLAGPSNHRRVGYDAAAEAVCEAARLVAEEAGVELPVAVACCCLAGVGREAEHQEVRQRLEAAGLAERVCLKVDAEAALAGAVPEGAAVVVIAGTGAVAWGRDAEGKRGRADGWGPLLGDEGSAAWIGREALKAAARAQDGRGPATALETAVARALGAETVAGLLSLPEPTTAQVAGLARECDAAARRGDEVAADILGEAGQRLATAAEAVAQRLGLSDYAVSWAGGAFASKALREAFRWDVEARLPGARVVAPRYEPVVGAGLLALAEVEGGTATADRRAAGPTG